MPDNRFLRPATLVLLTLALSGCWSDANTYPYPLAETKERLAGEKMSYRYKDNVFYLSIKEEHGNSLMVTLKSPATYWQAECIVMLETVDKASTRLVPDCGESYNEYQQDSYEAVEETIAEKMRIILSGEDSAATQATS